MARSIQTHELAPYCGGADSHIKMNQNPLEEIVDRDGSVIAGWLDHGVLYARFERTISASLGQRFAVRLEAFARQGDCIRYFTDMSGVACYDLLARSALVKAVIANRARFRSITTLTWAEGITTSGQAIAAAMGIPIEYVATREAFEHSLTLAAPSARARLANSAARAPSSHRVFKTP